MAEKGVEEQVLAMERLRKMGKVYCTLFPTLSQTWRCSSRDVWFTIYGRNVPRQTQTR